MDGREGSLGETLRAVEAARRRSEGEGAARRYREDSRARLLRILRRKNTTSFIGAIAAFERHFGRLWGHGRPESRLTEAELACRRRWEECRNEVLNNGNHQARAVENELSQYTVRWDRYVTTLPAAGGAPGVTSVSEPPQQEPEEGR